jgi:hypothetical protein
VKIQLRKHTHNLLSQMCRLDMQHNTCYREEQDGGHSWCNGPVVPDSWHNSVDMAHTYFDHNLEVSSHFVLIQTQFYYTLHISACYTTGL